MGLFPLIEAFIHHQDLDHPITHSLNTQDAGVAAASQVNVQTRTRANKGVSPHFDCNYFLQGSSEVTSELNPKTKVSHKCVLSSTILTQLVFWRASGNLMCVFVIINLCVLYKHQRTGVMGVMQKVNPFKSASQVKRDNI